MGQCIVKEEPVKPPVTELASKNETIGSMMQINWHGTFICSMYGKTTAELLQFVKQSADEAIELFLGLYAKDFDDIPNKLLDFNVKAYHKIKKMNIALDFLMIKETNEMKRIMYDECLKYACCETTFYNNKMDIEVWDTLNSKLNLLVTFYGNMEHARHTMDDLTTISEMYERNMETSIAIEKNAHLLRYTNMINWAIGQMYRIKIRLEKDNYSEMLII